MRFVCLSLAFAVGCVLPPQPSDPMQDPAPMPEEPVEPALGHTPVPISGGTLLLLRDDTMAAVSDPDRDKVWLFDLVENKVLGSVAFPTGSHPLRAAVDGAGHVHVVLRGSGSVAELDPVARTVVATRPLCPEPRGVTYDAARDRLLFACQGGELIELSPATGVATVTRLQRDLRDVVLLDGAPAVTTFRTAEVQPLTGPAGAVKTQSMMGTGGGVGTATVTIRPGVAWRTVARQETGLVMVHQRQVVAESLPGSGPPPPLDDHPYANGPLVGGCGPTVVGSVLSVPLSSSSLATWRSTSIPGVLPVDVAASATSDIVAVAFAGSRTVGLFDLSASNGGCATPFWEVGGGQFTGVAFTRSGRVIAHSRSPAFVRVGIINEGTIIPYADDPVDSPGSALFHSSPATGEGGGAGGGTGGFGGAFGRAALACASCHPEGGEDGLTWNIEGPPRRTQALTGGLASRAPFHWQGKHAELADVMKDTFVKRMGGTPPTALQVNSLKKWLDGLPAPRPSTAVNATGRDVFERAGCTACHGGTLLTNNAIVSVRWSSTEGFKVPSLIGLQARAPYMHDGCAATVRERFFKPGCGGDAHGAVLDGRFTVAEVDDLIAYLEAL